jgi:trimeric autotransporter adhesin
LKSLAPALFFLLCLASPNLLRAQDPSPSPQAPSVQSPPEPATQTPPPAPVSFEISGVVKAGKTPLPGVTVTASNTLTGKKFVVATAANGTYTFAGLPRGRYVVRIEFMGFAPQTQEVVLKPETPTGKFDAEMILASRQQDQGGLGNLAALVTAGRGFQSLAMDGALSALAGGGIPGVGGGPNANGGDPSSLPLNGAGAEGPTESVSITGAQGRTQDFGGGSEDDIQERIQEFRDRAQREGGNLQGGGQGGGLGGGPGGVGPAIVMMSRLPRNFNINQPHGMLYVSDDTASLDAKSYSLTGLATPKASYDVPRFGAFLGGPLNIPKIFNGGNKTFFFAGWNANRGSTPYDAFSTVPTLAERNGDFSAATYKDGSPVQIFNPKTGQQLQSNGQLNVIDPTLISSSTKALLAFIPLPNLNNPTQNFHFVTSGSTSSDSVNVRIIHNFGASPGPGPISIGPGGIGGGGGRRRAQNNVNFGLNWTRSATTLVNPFPSLAGGNSLQGLNASAGWVYSHGRATNLFRVNYNHNHVATTNLFSNVQNVAGNAGITGVSTNPFDWGIPGINFSSFSGLTDPIPRRELDQTYTFSDTLSWSRGKHNWRFGGDYRRILQSFRSAKNAEGSFVFTGFATSQVAGGVPVANTGYDFADFLLGLPQQTTLQSGTNSYDFRANSFDVYAQDDFRFRPNLSFNLGLRYEYNGPYTEGHNQIANLDVGSSFAGAAPVLPGQTGSFNGGFPASLIRPDRNNFAPRIGIAWRPMKQTVVRAGYGINYNLAQYGTIIQNFAFQPPFAITSTNVSTPTNLLTLQNGFPVVNSAVTNNFAVDPNYRLGYVQIWNLDIQRQLPANVVLNLDYNGSKGTRLDVERAITIAGVQPFIYESSAGNSVYHSGSIRLRKRMAHGVSISGTYAYSKSIDDASSIGGGGTVVAQNPFDIAADRGLSSFDQRHKFTGNWIYELPFGESHRFAQHGALSHILDGWQWSGDFTIGSGLYFTPRVLGNSVDIGRGVSGSLRANATGAPLSISNPTTLEWFNTAAFCSPTTGFGSSTPGSGATCANPTGSSFGDAGRNIIQGPGQITFDMNLAKIITIKESRALELRIQAANVFNTAHFSAINTIVNSLTYGEVTSVGNMRRVTLLARFRF